MSRDAKVIRVNWGLKASAYDTFHDNEGRMRSGVVSVESKNQGSNMIVRLENDIVLQLVKNPICTDTKEPFDITVTNKSVTQNLDTNENAIIEEFGKLHAKEMELMRLSKLTKEQGEGLPAHTEAYRKVSEKYNNLISEKTFHYLMNVIPSAIQAQKEQEEKMDAEWGADNIKEFLETAPATPPLSGGSSPPEKTKFSIVGALSGVFSQLMKGAPKQPKSPAGPRGTHTGSLNDDVPEKLGPSPRK